MILLYSGAVTPDATQINAEKSLGGFISSTGIPNGRLANLFSTISKTDVLNKVFDIRLIVLKNITGNVATNVKIYSNVADSRIKLKIAAVLPATNSCSQLYFESVYDSHTLPYQATLDYHEGIDNAIIAGDIANNAVVGIWIIREIDQTKFPEFGDTSSLTGQQLYDLLKEVNSIATENVQLLIDYNN